MQNLCTHLTICLTPRSLSSSVNAEQPRVNILPSSPSKYFRYVSIPSSDSLSSLPLPPLPKCTFRTRYSRVYFYSLHTPLHTLRFRFALSSPCLFCSFIYGLRFFHLRPPLLTPPPLVFMAIRSLKCKCFSCMFRGHYSPLLLLIEDS